MIYRVTVTAEPSGDEAYETLLEIAGPAQMIGRLAPTAVLEAVATRTEAVRSDLAERVFDGAVAAGVEQGAMSPAAPAAEAPKQRRPRRTKAQIEADKAAAEASGRPAPADDDEPDAEPVEPAAAVDLPQAPPAAEVPAAPAGNPEAPAANAAPYNPFAAG